MPIAQSSEAGRVVASNLQARRQQAAADAKRDSESLFGERPDTTTPLVGKAPMEDVPEPPKATAPVEPVPAAEPTKPARSIALRTTVQYRDYLITITATGYTLDQFCDMIDRRLGAVS